MSIKGLLFDFGGTIDTGGIHWFRYFLQSYKEFDLDIDEDIFREAYIFAERRMAKIIIPPDTRLSETLGLKIYSQINYLRKNTSIQISDKTGRNICNNIFHKVSKTIAGNIEYLSILKQFYKIGIVSNFYGNLKSIMQEFEVLYQIDCLIDSGEINIRKPDKTIWQMGIDALKLENNEVVIIGDSYKNDIAPAIELGARSIWLKNKSWVNDDDQPDYDIIISDFSEITNVIINMD